MNGLLTFLAKAKVCNRSTKRCAKAKTRFGIDTGATTTFGSRRALHFLEAKLGPIPRSPVMAGTPGGVTALERSEQVNLCLLQSCVKGISFVPADIPVDLMLGADFLDANGCAVDYKSRRLTCRNFKSKLEKR
ncbi:MAG: hypothetical protein ACREH5_03190 [Candidatus Omnitrophota bacterium]